MPQAVAGDSYRVQMPQQGIIGPVSEASLRALGESGMLHGDVLVSKGNGPFLPIRAFQELVDLLGDRIVHGPTPTYAGDLSQRGFADLFERLASERSTGRLVVRNGVQRKEIYLESGRSVFVMSNVARERLGDRLVTSGRVERESVNAALATMRDKGQSLGETLVEAGALTQPALRDELREQTIDRLLDLTTWREGQYSFYAEERYEGRRVELGEIRTELTRRLARQSG